MSVAKAALIWFYGFMEEYYDCAVWLMYDMLNDIHAIVDIAGCKHCGMFTSEQVIRCLRNSPYWEHEFIPRMFSGMRGQQGACKFMPSDKGKKYYKKHLKDKVDVKEIAKKHGFDI